MDSETASIRSSLSRHSTFLGRPGLAPLGPRTRTSSRMSTMVLSDALKSPALPSEIIDASIEEEDSPSTPSTSSRDLKTEPPVVDQGAAPAYYHEDDEEEREEPEEMMEPPLTARPVVSGPLAPVPFPRETPSPEPIAEPTPVAPVASTPSSSRASTPVIVPKVISTVPIAPPPKLVPPPVIKFETTPVPWKHLPLEAALWTVDSQELQGLVSRAIRSSAQESFIKLLTADNLDNVLPAELQRLETQRLMTQSKYRFLVHRRTMLFQALNSSSTSGPKEEGSVVSRLTAQLAETIAECEVQLELLLQISDQVCQITKLIEGHWGSALAIALRKLNGSYARRTQELNEAQERIRQLEGELEEAWREAEKVARELDDYEAAIVADDEVAIIEAAEIVPIPKTPISPVGRTIPLSPTYVNFGGNPHPSSSADEEPPRSPTLSLTLKAKETDAEDVPEDTVSIKSGRSTRSTKSHGNDATFSSAIQAARKRSLRASKGSLRLSSQHRRKSSGTSGKSVTLDDDREKPPVPDLPSYYRSTSPQHEEEDSRSPPPVLRRQASLDTVCTNGVKRQAYGNGSASDDIYIRPQNVYKKKEPVQLISGAPQMSFSSAMSSLVSTAPALQPLPPPRPPRDPSRTGTGSQWKNAAVKPSGGISPVPGGDDDLTQTPYGRQSQGEDDQGDADAGDSLSPLRPVYSMGHSHDRSVSTVSSFSPSRRSGESNGHNGLLGLTPSNASLQAGSDPGLASPSSPPPLARSKSSAAAKLRGLTQRYSVSLSMPLKVTNRLGSLGRKNG